jgi:hypothetical protein
MDLDFPILMIFLWRLSEKQGAEKSFRWYFEQENSILVKD